MTSNDTSDQEMERRLQAYFEAEAVRLRAPDDLWDGIEDRLENTSDSEDPRPAWQGFFSPRRWGPLPAFVTTLILLIGVSGAWLFTAAPWQAQAPQDLKGGPGPSAPTPTPTLAPGMVPVPMVDANLIRLPDKDSAATATDSPLPSATGPQGAPGAAGARGTGVYTAGALDTTQRQIISQASVSVEVEDVPAAVDQVRATAESLGGFVGQLSSSGGPERQQSTMTVRVPQLEFFAALERIKSLGTVRSENVGSEDVTEQFIDLEARLRSAQREEESLLSLLERAENVSEILTIERELSRVRSDLERYQGQLNFLERRVDLATITVSLFPPEARLAEPPSGSLTLEVSDVSSSVDEVKALVSRVNGELDQVFVSVKDGKERADLTLRVFSKDFGQVVSSVEAQGSVRSKEVREGTPPAEGEATPSEKPDARFAISFVEKGSLLVGWIATIGPYFGGAVLVVLLGFLFYFTYHVGRRRGSQA